MADEGVGFEGAGDGLGLGAGFGGEVGVAEGFEQGAVSRRATAIMALAGTRKGRRTMSSDGRKEQRTSPQSRLRTRLR